MGTAKDYGERSLAAAQEAEDDMWQLHALVLISQSEVKSGRLSASLISFEKAFDDVNSKIARREQEGGEEPDDTMESDRSAGDKDAKLDESKESQKEEAPPPAPTKEEKKEKEKE